MSDHDVPIELRPIDQTCVITVAPIAVAAPSDLDCVVHNLETGTTYRLNDVGARVWELVEQNSTIADIATTIRAEYSLPDDMTPEHVVNDVTKIIADLHQFGLVVLNEPDPE